MNATKNDLEPCYLRDASRCAPRGLGFQVTLQTDEVAGEGLHRATLFSEDSGWHPRKHLILRSRIAQTTAVNAPIFWGPFEAMVPGVSFNDRFLDVVVFEDTSRHKLALRMFHFLSRRHQRPPGKDDWHARYPDLLPAEGTDIPGIHHVQARGITISTESEQEAVTGDGEVYAQTPVEARVADERMRFIVPQDQSKSASRDINVRKQGRFVIEHTLLGRIVFLFARGERPGGAAGHGATVRVAFLGSAQRPQLAS